MSNRLEISGVLPALITPFLEDGSVDYESLEKIIDNMIKAGVSGLVPLGTTGESPTLTAEEKEKILKLSVKKAKESSKKVLVIAGTGSNSTAAAVVNTQKAKDLGCDGCLIVNPYYNKPSQRGLVAHVKEINKVGLPIVLYNIPGRSAINMEPETVAEIYKECDQVCAVKEATGSLDQAMRIRSLCDITLLSGDDPLTIPLSSIGGKGVISVLGNYRPDIMVEMCEKLDEQHLAKHLKLIKSMFVEINPVPVKYAMYKVGMIKTPKVRLPLVEMEDKNKELVEKTIAQY
eukprot:augustus_masked-scaffold_7-processed-gene-5.3-mRNA-1 protein AED:0.01 eAED:0.01 QI:0/-1/0/1/-1/1/1/0/288